ncbi:erythroblast NAD(P)(+)--arginine ADP-ribosyltransferase-like [Huso huso]|uniref:NAD(P)(+)--arginine ADP-ribosyltransferase n=1 Tax=Huso huso TaxID=61971 RepID=A0ABR0Y835_HUSHU
MKCDSSIPMDLAEDALDDQYQGCRETMLKNINTTHLPSELNKNPALRKAWKIAQRETKRQRHKELSLEQATAIYVYTMDDNDVYSAFNTAVRTGGTNYTEFPFKAWHFYLTDALKRLRSNKEKCYKVYRGVNLTFTTAADNIVRFGQFASTSLKKNKAKEFGEKTLFTIRTCLGVRIEKYSAFNTEKEVLIPPFERFKVIVVRGNKIQLEHIKKKKSNFNCGRRNSV